MRDVSIIKSKQTHTKFKDHWKERITHILIYRKMTTAWSTARSFRDVILEKPQSIPSQTTTSTIHKANNNKSARSKIQSKFVVVKPVPRRQSRRDWENSLQNSSDDCWLVLGETDAAEYYNRKALGAIGRRNGKKTRPDEATRLQMTMSKKNQQRQRQLNGL